MKRRAFTLVEILLTVAIIAILATATLGLYKWSRTRAGITLSSNNLHQLVIANLNYATDHAGYFCPAQDERNLRRWHGSRRNIEEAFEPEGGFLTPYLGNDKRLETCPLLARVLDGKASFEDGSGGYGYNATYIGGRPGDIYAPAALLDIEVASRTVMFATTALSKTDGIQEYPFAEPPFAPTESGGRAWDLQPSVHFRADGKALVAWCDGRVTLEKPRAWSDTNFYGGNNEKDLVGWFGPEEENGFWNPRSPAVLNGWTPPDNAPEQGKSGHGAGDEKKTAESR